jgi:hypothetical protein
MATIAKYKLNGIEYAPPREWQGVEILATFDGDSVQANITTSEFTFVNDAKNAIDSWFASYPTEGMPLQVSISNETNTYGAFSGFLDFRTAQYMSDVESKYGIQQDNGLTHLDTRLKGITMLLLEQKGHIVTSDFSQIPYIVENRKTILEKVYLLFQLYNLIKTGYDEVHKFINIASDIASAGIAFAFINLTVSITALILLIQQIVDLLQEIQESFFPPIRYHKGISLYKAIQRAVGYCGYGLDCGSFEYLLRQTHLCPSKNDEVGITSPTSTLSGILNPSDFGYISSDLFTLANQLFYTKVAIVGLNVVLRPYNDPYWTQSPSYVLPNMKVEQAFVKNGTRSINYNELMSSRIIQYTTDDSDLWTLTTVADQISVTTVTPITVINENRVLLTGSEQINIPYALCVRKDVFDDLLDIFIGVDDQLQYIKDLIETQFNAIATTLGQSFPLLANYATLIPKRTGCMKIENNFFSTPKIVYLDSETNRIPENFSTIIGAVALNNNYHSYKSFVQGIRNPLILTDTNCKDVFEGVTIPMGINDFNTLIGNSFFLTDTGILGKFTSIKWLPDKDKAVCDYWTQGTWATNIEQTTI